MAEPDPDAPSELDLIDGLSRELLDKAPDAILVTDGRGRIVFANHQVERLFGFSPHGLRGQEIDVLIPERFRHHHHQHLGSYFANPATRPMGTGLELLGRHRDGSEFPVEISLSPVSTDQGRLVSAAIRDVTANKLIEEELRRAREAAESSNQTKTRFLAAASHDLRQPLQAALMYAGVLRRTRADNDDNEIPRKLENALRALQQLLNKLLDISKLDAGVVHAEPMPTSLAFLFERLEDLLSDEAAAKGLELRIAPTRCQVLTDPQLLEQLLQNLIANAIRYTDRGRILVGCRRDAETVRVQVWDTGVGIPSDQLDTIFDEFYQVGGSGSGSNQGLGLGLGLAIVRMLGRLMGHEVRVRSWPERGTVFEVLVPKAERPALPSQVLRSHHLDETGHTGRIVLIDDDPEVLYSSRLALESNGHEVVAVPGLLELAAELESDAVRPDVIITDFRLQGSTTGVEAIDLVHRRFDSAIPSIVLTGENGSISRRPGEDTRLVVLQKPIAPTDLERIVQDLLSSIGA